jgi:serine/threonine-protein kinase
VFASRYEVLEPIGKGGMGTVFRARDRQLDEVVALKVLRDDALSEDATLLDRFKQELKLARRITHKNVLRTHDFGEANGTAYISMEYLEGVTLKDLIRSKGALPLAVGLRIAKHMCQGLEAAHAQGVVHRDVKPQNMLILPETGELKIGFGIARVGGGRRHPGLTTDGSVLGTPDYMPPEQATGGTADFRPTSTHGRSARGPHRPAALHGREAGAGHHGPRPEGAAAPCTFNSRFPRTWRR